MASHRVIFEPIDKSVSVDSGATLLEAAARAQIAVNSVCAGEGSCGRCKMMIKKGRVREDSQMLLTLDEIARGVVLACQTHVEDDLVVEIPEHTRATEKTDIDAHAERFRADEPDVSARSYKLAPLVTKVLLELEAPTLENNLADCERVIHAIQMQTEISGLQAGLEALRRLPGLLRENNFRVTATVGQRGEVAEIIDFEGGNTTDEKYAAVVDVGTSTIVVHLVDAITGATIATEACFNSQGVYGPEITTRLISAEKKGIETIRRPLLDDINYLISAAAADVGAEKIAAVVCAGNTSMIHFLLGLPIRNIRRHPYISATVEPPPLRAAEVGIKISPRGLLYCCPGVSSWVGGDLTAGILATGLADWEGVAMLIDVGTNGEIILGNTDWLISCSASTGPALEGASVECGMMAAEGAIERIYVQDGDIRYDVIGGAPPDGLCGSAIVDALAVLLRLGVVDRNGSIVDCSHEKVRIERGMARFVLVEADPATGGRDVFITQDDIDNVISAKAAIFAATKILLDRLRININEIDRLFVAGGFGNYINLDNAIAIGLLPDLPRDRFEYVGNTSVRGAKLAALSCDAFRRLHEIRGMTTYYDLMGSQDYVEQFRQAMFLPHTNIELFPSTGKTDGENSASCHERPLTAH
jgi:uncharacterized 2Fe-2S/4Fe-4S cluster protein (DUF4445 family)